LPSLPVGYKLFYRSECLTIINYVTLDSALDTPNRAEKLQITQLSDSVLELNWNLSEDSAAVRFVVEVLHEFSDDWELVNEVPGKQLFHILIVHF